MLTMHLFVISCIIYEASVLYLCKILSSDSVFLPQMLLLHERNRFCSVKAISVHCVSLLSNRVKPIAVSMEFHGVNDRNIFIDSVQFI